MLATLVFTLVFNLVSHEVSSRNIKERLKMKKNPEKLTLGTLKQSKEKGYIIFSWAYWLKTLTSFDLTGSSSE